MSSPAQKADFDRLYRETPLGAVAIARRLHISVNIAKRWRRESGLPIKKKTVHHRHDTRTLATRFACAWWAEVKREQDALIALDRAWGRAAPKKTIEERRKIGRDAARLRYQRYGNTAEWKIRQAARNAVSRIARVVGHRRRPKTRTFDYLGCDYDFARTYLEARWLSGMTWENYGSAWHIDHVLPLATFDLTKERERKKAMHFTNLQPLWGPDNRKKWAKTPQQTELRFDGGRR